MVIEDLGLDLRGVRRAPVIVGQVDRGGGVAHGDDPGSDVAEIVPVDVDRRPAVDRERAEKTFGAQRVGRAGCHVRVSYELKMLPSRVELAAGVDDDLGVVAAVGAVAVGGVEGGAGGLEQAAVADHDLRAVVVAVVVEADRVAGGEAERAVVGHASPSYVARRRPDRHRDVGPDGDGATLVHA